PADGDVDAGLPDENGPGAGTAAEGGAAAAPGLAGSVRAAAMLEESDTAVAAVLAICRRAAPACVGVAMG
ncbi:hypothetical protein, partial [Lysobacter enzymogenes]|uniref:hypothetical protein n=1 Tax=Lysobacter enzymogenes TaxID=69 RepID=UPI0019D0B519